VQFISFHFACEYYLSLFHFSISLVKEKQDKITNNSYKLHWFIHLFQDKPVLHWHLMSIHCFATSYLLTLMFLSFLMLEFCSISRTKQFIFIVFHVIRHVFRLHCTNYAIYLCFVWRNVREAERDEGVRRRRPQNEFSTKRLLFSIAITGIAVILGSIFLQRKADPSEMH
jgi:hypothetical protein